MRTNFTSLIDSVFLRVHRAAFGFLGEREIAREAAQEALMKAYMMKESYDSNRPFYPWMYRIVKNTCLDIRKRKRRDPTVLGEVDILPGDSSSPFSLLVQKQQEKRLWSAMKNLAEDQKELINLRHFQDLSYAEMAEILSIPIGTVMSRLYRARKALTTNLMEE